VQTPPRPLITIPNILKAAGQTARSPHGGSLKVVEVKRLANRRIMLRAQLENLGGNFSGPPGMVVMVGGVGGGAAFLDQPGFVGPGILSLQDAKGQAFRLAGVDHHTMRPNGNGFTQESSFTFQPQRGQWEPAQLVFSGSRTVVLDVPFTLKDVPLP
jgi:hypothetical protein